MNEQWQRPAPLWRRAAPLALVVVGIIASFIYMEKDRSERLVGESMRFAERLDGTILSANMLTPQMTDDHWERITSIPTIEHVDLTGVDDWEGGLEPLTKLPLLEALTLSRCKALDDDQLIWLTENLSLKRLDVAECRRITDRSIPALVDCTALEQVDLWGTSVTLKGLEQLREARRDMRISMNWDAYVLLPQERNPSRKATPSFGDSMEWLAVKLDSYDHAHPAVLKLRHNWKTGEWLADPGSQVLHLTLSGHDAGHELSHLAKVLRNLVTLSVSETYLPDDVGDWSPRLTYLHLSELTEGSNLSGFANCPSLTSVTLWDRKRFVESDLSFLTALPHLQSVTLGAPAATPAEVELITGLATLRALSLYGMTDTTIAPLLDGALLPELEDLMLYDSELSDETIEQLTSVRPELLLSQRSLP